MPAVTIGLAVYNAERYLKECVDSIIAQTFKDFEVIAVLDAPQDESETVLRRCADTRFRILINEKNIGQGPSANIILREAQCSLIARMDADDIMLPERIERQFAYMTEHPEIAVLGSHFDLIDQHGKVTEQGPGYPLDHEGIVETFRVKGVMHHPTVMYRKEKIMEAGAYDPELRYAEDLSLWLRCMIRGHKFANLPDTLLHYRIHNEQLMSSKLEQTLQAIDHLYAQYGLQIWGENAPDYVGGINKWHRLWRRIKRKLSN